LLDSCIALVGISFDCSQRKGGASNTRHTCSRPLIATASTLAFG